MLPFFLRCARRYWVKASSDGQDGQEKLEIHCHNIRDYTQDSTATVSGAPVRRRQGDADADRTNLQLLPGGV